MNKKINIILALLLVIALLAGCSNSATTNNETDNNDNQQEQGNEPVDQGSNGENNEDQDVDGANDDNQDAEDDNEVTDDEVAIDNPFRYLSDNEYSFDINNDGQADDIIFHNNYDTMNMTINGKTYDLEDHYAELTLDSFMLTDIDATDNYLEIVIDEADPPFGEFLIFYRYDGEKFYSIGTVSIGFLEENQERVFIDGNGGVLATDKSNIMEKGFYHKLYSINENGTLEETLPEDIYSYISPITSKVNKEIKGYEGSSTDKSYEAIPAGEEIVIYGEIDNWLYIKWNDKELWVNNDELTHFVPGYPEEKFEFDGIQFWS